MGPELMVYRVQYTSLTIGVLTTKTINFEYTKNTEYGICMFDVRCGSDPRIDIGVDDQSINEDFDPTTANLKMGAQVEYFCKDGLAFNDTGVPSPSITFTLGTDLLWDRPSTLPQCFGNYRGSGGGGGARVCWGLSLALCLLTHLTFP